MAQPKIFTECLNWINDQQKSIDSVEFGENKKSLEETLSDLKKQTNTISRYQSNVEMAKKDIKDQEQKDQLEQAYQQLLASSQKRLRCTETSSQILQLDDLITPLCQGFASTAVGLVQGINKENGPAQFETSSSATSQDCILATRDAWEHVARQLKCAETHLKNASEYQQFFHDAKEYQQWMPAELKKAEELIKGKTGQTEDAQQLLSNIQSALTTFLHWRGKMESMTERSKKVLPIHLRLQKLNHERPVLSIDNYQTNDVKIRNGEELTLMDNSNKQMWKVRNMRGDVSLVPSTQLVIQGPDTAAVDAANKLRLQFLSDWTNTIKNSGKKLIKFLSQIIKDCSPEEEKMLKSLDPSKKQQIQQLLTSIGQIFSPVWDAYPLYKRVRSKMDKLRQILGDRTSPISRSTESDKLAQNDVLVSRTDNVDDLLSSFKDCWQNWEQFKMLTELSRQPELLLAVTNPDQYKFVSADDMKKKWQSALLDFDEADFNETGDMEEMLTRTIEDEVYTIETAKETAETSQLTTSEQEERQTFVITGVTDPRNGEQISLDRAVSFGIINQRDGKYVNPQTGESMPIPTAMNAGKIKVEFTRTNKSVEKKSDIGLITIKTYKESRPFNVKAVVDAKTERQMPVEEAIRAGIMDQKRGIYINKNTKEELSLSDALDSGLLIVEFENDAENNKTTTDPSEYVSKTYAIHAVIDTKTKARKSFSEAIDAGLIDQETGAYCNKSTGEYVYVGDAIKKGFIKATVVNDPKTLDIAPANRMTLPDTDIDTFRHKVLQPATSGSATFYTNHSNGTARNDVSNGSRWS